MRVNQRGSIMVLGALLLLTLTSFAVLAFDAGRIFVTRNELQNAADSAALAGANCLTRTAGGSASDCTSTISSTLNWATASAKSAAQLGANTAANTALQTSGAGQVVEVGYWNLSTRSPSGGSFSTTFSPVTPNDKPAVRVQVIKAPGVNDGPLFMLTRAIWGAVADVSMAAEAVAVISAPSTIAPLANNLIPQVINLCMFDRFWDSVNNRPVIYTGTPPDPYNLSTVGQPWTVRIGSAYHYDACDSGQWSTFNQNVNSQSAMRELIQNGNSTEIGIGDDTWIQPGTRDSGYRDLDAKYPTAAPGDYHDVTVLVIDEPLLHSQNQDFQAEIVGIAGFRILDIQRGSDKYIEGQFIPSNVTPGGSGVGPFLGTYTPPRLGR